MAVSYTLLRVGELQVACSSIGQKLLPTGVDAGLLRRLLRHNSSVSSAPWSIHKVQQMP